MTATAFLKVYTDAGHASEVAHTTQNATTLNGSVVAAATALTLTSVTGMPTSGYLDIIDGTNGNETIQYYGLSGFIVQLATPLAFLHPTACVVNQWYYILAVGDQALGIPNDGTNAGLNGVTNIGTWYVYNFGGNTAQSPVFTTSNAAGSTVQGFADSLISITSISAGFLASVSPSNIAAAAQQQIWVAAEIPNGQSAAGNPQICLINLAYSTV